MNILEGVRYVTEQGELGRKRGEQNRFRSLTANALAGDQDAIAQQVALDPTQAKEVQSAGDGQAKRLRGAAKYMETALKAGNPAQIQGAWGAVGPYLAKLTGKEAPPQWDPSYEPGLQQVLAKTAYLDGGADSGEVPTGFRQFQMTAEAAGLKEGTPEYQQAANIALGREGRAATGGFSFEMIRGADGLERPGRRNPRTGVVEIYDEASGDFMPLGGPAAINGGSASAGGDPQAGGMEPTQGSGIAGGQGPLDISADLQQFASLGIPVSSTLRDPSRNAKVGGVGNSYHLTGEAVDVDPRTPEQKQQATQFWQSKGYQVIDEGDHLHVEPPRRGMTVNPIAQAGVPGPARARAASLAVGRSPEEQAALTTGAQEAARARAQLQYGDQLGQQDARNSAAAEEAKQTAQTRVELQQLLPKVQSESRRTVALIDKALNHPGRAAATGATSRFDPRNFVPGTDATNFRVLLEQLKGGTFLQAFQSLKGGGAITQVEGTKAEQAIARLDQAQSDEEFIVALNDLREVALGLPASLQAKLAAAGAGGAQSRTQAPASASDDDEALIGKYL